jgi:hypothetical protein
MTLARALTHIRHEELLAMDTFALPDWVHACTVRQRRPADNPFTP